MTFYPFMNEKGESWGSFETMYVSRHDPSWWDPDTWMGELLLQRMGIEEDEDALLEIMDVPADAAGDENRARQILNKLRSQEPESENEKAYKEDLEGEIRDLEGWYWQAGFPGCLPDGEPMGPFASEMEAIADAWCMHVSDVHELFRYSTQLSKFDLGLQ